MAANGRDSNDDGLLVTSVRRSLLGVAGILLQYGPWGLTVDGGYSAYEIATQAAASVVVRSSATSAWREPSSIGPSRWGSAYTSLRPGEEKMTGVMCGIDAVGYQARRFDKPDQQNPIQVIEELVHVVNPTGRIGIVGVYFPEDPGGVDKHAKHGQFQLPLGAIFDKGLSIGTGQTPVKKYNAYLRDLVVAGRAKPSFIVSHRLTLDEVPAAHAKFDLRTDGYTKVVLKPEASAPA